MSEWTHLVIWSGKKSAGNNVTLFESEQEARQLAVDLRSKGDSAAVCRILDFPGPHVKISELL